MSVSCSHFALLKGRIELLSSKFVDDQIAAEQLNPLTFVPDIDRLAAYRLLVHAEFEHFLESKAKEHVTASETRIASGLPWMREFPSLLYLAMVLQKTLPTPDMASASRINVFLDDLLSSAKSLILRNNSIKTTAFTLLSVCAGKALDEIDTVLSSGLNSYGKDRGDVAHKSMAHCTSIQAPSVEHASANSLVAQLASYFNVCP